MAQRCRLVPGGATHLGLGLAANRRACSASERKALVIESARPSRAAAAAMRVEGLRHVGAHRLAHPVGERPVVAAAGGLGRRVQAGARRGAQLRGGPRAHRDRARGRSPLTATSRAAADANAHPGGREPGREGDVRAANPHPVAPARRARPPPGPGPGTPASGGGAGWAARWRARPARRAADSRLSSTWPPTPPPGRRARWWRPFAPSAWPKPNRIPVPTSRTATTPSTRSVACPRSGCRRRKKDWAGIAAQRALGAVTAQWARVTGRARDRDNSEARVDID